MSDETIGQEAEAQVPAAPAEQQRSSRGPSLNQVQLIGRLARDPELRYTPSGKAVSRMRVMVNDGPEPQGFDLVSWAQDAEFAGEYLKKGALIHVNGRLRVNRWADRDTGEIKSRVEVDGARVQGLERAREAERRSERRAEQEGAER
jgi:single-strand DNA-binding protein